MNQAKSPDARPHIMKYELQHLSTQSGTGCFAPLPVEDFDFENGLEYIREHPNDEFMHKHLLQMAGTFGPNLTCQLIERGKDDNPHLLALIYEACILNERLHALTERFRGTDIKKLAEHTPLIYINWSLKKERDKNAPWLELFSEKIYGHKTIPPPKDLGLPIPFEQVAMEAWRSRVVPITRLFPQPGPKSPQKGTMLIPSPTEIATMATEGLKRVGFSAGPETKTLASLSPCAVEIPWRLEVSVATGRNHWQLAGIQTSYGKGLNIDESRASCLMEVVERCSAFASFDSEKALHFKHGYALVKARLDDLRRTSHDVLDPNEMHLEVPYQNQPLYWICAERVDENGSHPAYVPAQLVFLFCNLDEICLTSGLPSTGLAAGNTLEEAKLHALLEVIERDAERVVPYCEKKRFSLKSDCGPVREIFKQCTESGVEIKFLNITSEFGIPCYKAFIEGPNGEILKGCAAHLDGKKAVVSALTELPYHTSWFRPVPAGHGLKAVEHDSLTDYASGDADHDLGLLERLLVMNGYQPIYVNLTRRDLDIPVVKALIPGLEMFNDFDRFSSLSLRQFAHHLNDWK